MPSVIQYKGKEKCKKKRLILLDEAKEQKLSNFEGEKKMKGGKNKKKVRQMMQWQKNLTEEAIQLKMILKLLKQYLTNKNELSNYFNKEFLSLAK